jgi:hypothetical protein
MSAADLYDALDEILLLGDECGHRDSAAASAASKASLHRRDLIKAATGAVVSGWNLISPANNWAQLSDSAPKRRRY